MIIMTWCVDADLMNELIIDELLIKNTIMVSPI